jgi:hypothetical protein
VHRWSALCPYEFTVNLSTYNGKPVSSPRLELRTERGSLLLTFVNEQSGRVAALAAAAELPRARALLAAGQEVTYGRFRLTGQTLRFAFLTVPWSQIRMISTNDTSIVVWLHGRRRAAAQIPKEATPHLRALLALAAELTTEAQRRASAHTPPEPPDPPRPR